MNPPPLRAPPLALSPVRESRSSIFTFLLMGLEMSSSRSESSVGAEADPRGPGGGAMVKLKWEGRWSGSVCT